MEEGSRLSLPYSTPELLYQMWILAEDFNTNNEEQTTDNDDSEVKNDLDDTDNDMNASS